MSGTRKGRGQSGHSYKEEDQNQPENSIGGDDLVWTKSQGHR